MVVYSLGKNSICSGTYLPFILGLYHKLWVLQPKSSSQIQMGILEFIENGIYFITNHSVSLLAMRPLPPPSPCPASLLRSNLSMSKASTLTLASKGFWYLALVNATWQPQGHHYGAIQVKEAPTVLLTMAKTWMALSTLRPCL